jgi:hypothetical protein
VVQVNYRPAPPPPEITVPRTTREQALAATRWLAARDQYYPVARTTQVGMMIRELPPPGSDPRRGVASGHGQRPAGLVYVVGTWDGRYHKAGGGALVEYGFDAMTGRHLWTMYRGELVGVGGRPELYPVAEWRGPFTLMLGESRHVAVASGRLEEGGVGKPSDSLVPVVLVHGEHSLSAQWDSQAGVLWMRRGEEHVRLTPDAMLRAAIVGGVGGSDRENRQNVLPGSLVRIDIL